MRRIRETPKFLKELKMSKNGKVTCENAWTIVNGRITKVSDGPRSMKNVNSNDIKFMRELK